MIPNNGISIQQKKNCTYPQVKRHRIIERMPNLRPKTALKMVREQKVGSEKTYFKNNSISMNAQICRDEA